MTKPGTHFRDGHAVSLLQGSVEFFPALIAAFDSARVEIHFETYIFDFTASGTDIAEALIRAARRGVNVKLAVDGYGSEPFTPEWVGRLKEAGVTWLVYSLPGSLGMLMPGRWRRLHRKLCVVDGHTAFCGGINVLDDFHDPSYGTLDAPRFDFAVKVTGPLVNDVRRAMSQLWQRMLASRKLRHVDLTGALDALAHDMADADSSRDNPPTSRPHTVRAALVLRDNLRNRARIEKAYRRAIGLARDEIIIANAYFVPGAKLRRSLIMAAERGVKVTVLLQGKYEYFMQYYASRPVYGALLRAGVEIQEYSPSFLHAKVAVIDGHWATVGSSNLDPLSMLLAREANVIVEDAQFAETLKARLMNAMKSGGQAMDREAYMHRPFHQRVLERIAMGAMRFALLVNGKEY